MYIECSTLFLVISCCNSLVYSFTYLSTFHVLGTVLKSGMCYNKNKLQIVTGDVKGISRGMRANKWREGEGKLRMGDNRDSFKLSG